MRLSRSCRSPAAALVLGLLASGGDAAGAQETPPGPLPLREVARPSVLEAVLTNGARVVLVPNPESPLVTVDLVLSGGTAADAVGREGTTALLVQLLGGETVLRSADEMADTLAAMGSGLGPAASTDFISVRLRSLTEFLEPSLGVMADAVLRPAFSEDRLERVRAQTSSAIRLQSADPAVMADRAFLRALYGEHPYGTQPTSESVETIRQEDLAAYHRRHFRPGGALFVVAGDATLSEATAALEEAFEGWHGDGAPPGSPPPVMDRAAPEVILVHRPGSVRAEVRVGHLLEVDDPDQWTALTVATQLLGGGPGSRLSRLMRGERGYAQGATVGLVRRKGQGFFRIATSVRNEVLEAALTDLVREVDRLRDQLVEAEELGSVTDLLVGSFPQRIETPQQIGERLATSRILGRPEVAIESYRGRVASLSSEDLRRAFRRHVDPGRMALVVVGDAAVLASRLTSFGPVTLQDLDGRSLTEGDLVARGRSERLSLAGVGPMRLSYEVTLEGRRVGATERVVELLTEGALRFASVTELGAQTVEQEVTVGAEEMELRSSRFSASAQGRSVGGEVSLEGGRLVGSLTSGAGRTSVDMAVPVGVMVSDMLELAVWVAELVEGRSLVLPVANVQAGTVENVTLTVETREAVTVPAGVFETWRIRVEGSQAQTLWARVEAPHVVVQIRPDGQPIQVRLSSWTEGG